MPTYDYRCPEGHDFELFQRMSEEPRATCPECGAEAERLLSGGAGFLFKGDGFYITDYRSDSYRKAAKADEKAASGPAPEKSASESSPKKESGKKASKGKASTSAPASSGEGS